MILALLGCGDEADRSRLPALPDPPVVPPLPEAPPTGESRRYPLDLPGGGGGAPFGAALYVPPGSEGVVTQGALSNGGEGAQLHVPAPGDTVLCLGPQRVVGPVEVTLDLRVLELTGGHVEVELRTRDADGALLSPEGTRFVPLGRYAGPTAWEHLAVEARAPAGTRKAELCVRVVGGAGRIEVDAGSVVTPGEPLAAEAPIVHLDWPLDEPGGERGAPLGFEFLVPPGTRGAAFRVDPRGEARGLWLDVTEPGNAVACSQPFSLAPGMIGRARVFVDAVRADDRTWTGFVAELRAYDLVGGLASAGATPFLPLATWREPGEHTLERAFAAPDGAITGKLCFRFVEATGSAFVDAASVGE